MTRLLFLRTKSFRERFLSTVDHLYTAIEMAFRDPKNDSKVRRKVLKSFKKNKESYFTEFPLAQRKFFRTQIRMQIRKGSFRQFIEPVLKRHRDEWIKHADGAAEKGHLDGLSKILETLSAIDKEPDFEMPSNWILIRDESAFVLGDCCAFGVKNGHATAFLYDTSDKSKSFDIYIPISKSSVLVGRIIGSQQLLTVEQINIASVKQSFNAFYAPQNSLRENNLMSLIGESSIILENDELDEILNRLF